MATNNSSDHEGQPPYEENWFRMLGMAANDVAELVKKNASYGASWRKRGGVGAFMMMTRKIDRIENLAARRGYDIFAAMADDDGGIVDDIEDLVRYLLLIRDYHAHGLAHSTQWQRNATAALAAVCYIDNDGKLQVDETAVVDFTVDTPDEKRAAAIALRAPRAAKSAYKPPPDMAGRETHGG